MRRASSSVCQVRHFATSTITVIEHGGIEGGGGWQGTEERFYSINPVRPKMKDWVGKGRAGIELNEEGRKLIE